MINSILIFILFLNFVTAFGAASLGAEEKWELNPKNGVKRCGTKLRIPAGILRGYSRLEYNKNAGVFTVDGVIFFCSSCAYSSKSKGDCNKHVRAHLRQRYYCTHDGCGKSYANSSGLASHRRKKHGIKIPKLGKEDEIILPIHLSPPRESLYDGFFDSDMEF